MDADELYGLPLDRFVPERGALARELRTHGRREEAAEVARLRKPSVAAWAFNQLVRTQSRELAELFAAGDGLRQAHADAVSGRGGGPALRAALERERAAVEQLVQAARGLLTSEGHELSGTVLDRVADTLHAAAIDEDAREQARLGRLGRELRHVGLGDAQQAQVDTARRAEIDDGRQAQVKERREDESRRAAASRQARAAARAAEAAARRRAGRAERTVRLAEERCERAAEALQAAKDELAAARAEAQAAADEHRRALKELE
jgi:hypothetical protein